VVENLVKNPESLKKSTVEDVLVKGNEKGKKPNENAKRKKPKEELEKREEEV
jgi:hypothetical protein